MDEEIRTHRAARLRQELLDEGLTLPAGVMGDILVDELVSARYVEVHEGIRPTYGAIIADGLPHEEVKVPLEGTSARDVRALADGIMTFVGRDTSDERTLCIVHAPVGDEVEAVTKAMAVQGAVVQRHDEGTITVVFPDAVWVNELFTWRTGPVARHRAFATQELLGLTSDSLAVVVDLLEFAVHQLSPAGIGSTLVIPIDPEHKPTTDGFTDPGYLPPLDLSAKRASDLHVLRTFLRVVDGACIFTIDGTVERTQVKLAASEKAHTLLKPAGGTRHSSARWFSYDHPAYVVIVVSADGPVSVWSDGRKLVEVLHDAVDGMPSVVRTVPQDRDAIRTDVEEHTCDVCERTVETTLGADTGQSRLLCCEVCGADSVTTSRRVHRVRVSKPWWTKS